MIGHITLGTNNLPREADYYDALLAELGANRLMDHGRGYAYGVSMDTPSLGVTRPFDGKLVESILGCGNCHAPRTAIGELIRERHLAGRFTISASPCGRIEHRAGSQDPHRRMKRCADQARHHQTEIARRAQTAAADGIRLPHPHDRNRP